MCRSVLLLIVSCCRLSAAFHQGVASVAGLQAGDAAVGALDQENGRANESSVVVRASGAGQKKDGSNIIINNKTKSRDSVASPWLDHAVSLIQALSHAGGNSSQNRTAFDHWLVKSSSDVHLAVTEPLGSHGLIELIVTMAMVCALIVVAIAARFTGIVGHKASIKLAAPGAPPTSTSPRTPMLCEGWCGSFSGGTVHGGMAITVDGIVRSRLQDQSLKASCVGSGSKQVPLRILLSESAGSFDGGVLVETMEPRVPVAFLSTGAVVKRWKTWARSPRGNTVAISRVDPTTGERAAVPFAVIESIHGQFEVRAAAGVVDAASGRNGPPAGALLLAVRLDHGARTATVVDAQLGLAAALETKTHRDKQTMVLHISAGADPGLVLSAVIGAIKLS